MDDLSAFARTAAAETNQVARWKNAELLAARGREGVATAKELLRSESSSERIFGAEILGRVDPADHHLCGLAAGLLVAALGEADPDLGAQAAVNLARLPNVDLLDKLLALRHDERAGVRLAVAVSLYDYGADVVPALTELTKDTNADVRSWAAFRLASLEEPTVEAVGALRDLLDDPAPEVSGEAVVALARRGDSAAQAHIRRVLEAETFDPWVIDAVKAAPSPKYAELLTKLLRSLDDADEDDRSALLDAISICEIDSEDKKL